MTNYTYIKGYIHLMYSVVASLLKKHNVCSVSKTIRNAPYVCEFNNTP